MRTHRIIQRRPRGNESRSACQTACHTPFSRPRHPYDGSAPSGPFTGGRDRCLDTRLLPAEGVGDHLRCISVAAAPSLTPRVCSRRYGHSKRARTAGFPSALRHLVPAPFVADRNRDSGNPPSAISPAPPRVLRPTPAPERPPAWRGRGPWCCANRHAARRLPGCDSRTRRCIARRHSG
jgi:hypothetical protein